MCATGEVVEEGAGGIESAATEMKLWDWFEIGLRSEVVLG